MPGAVRLEDDTLDLEGPGYFDESRDEGGDVSGLGLEEADAVEGATEREGVPEGEEGEPEEVEEEVEVRTQASPAIASEYVENIMSVDSIYYFLHVLENRSKKYWDIFASSDEIYGQFYAKQVCEICAP